MPNFQYDNFIIKNGRNESILKHYSLMIMSFSNPLCYCIFFRTLHKNLHQKLLISLMFALLGLYVTFIISSAVSSNPAKLRTIPVVCGILSALLHYFFLVTFLCMAAIAINLYRALVVVFNAEIQSYLPIAVSLCWSEY